MIDEIYTSIPTFLRLMLENNKVDIKSFKEASEPLGMLGMFAAVAYVTCDPKCPQDHNTIFIVDHNAEQFLNDINALTYIILHELGHIASGRAKSVSHMAKSELMKKYELNISNTRDDKLMRQITNREEYLVDCIARSFLIENQVPLSDFLTRRMDEHARALSNDVFEEAFEEHITVMNVLR